MANELVPWQDPAQNTITPYLDLVTWQHQKPKYLETIVQTIRGHAQGIELLVNLYELFGIDTAVGVQLDMVGQWVGVTRYIETSIENIFFSWDDYKVGWEQGVWWSPYLPTSEFFRLDDEHYRFLLRARIVSNHWDGTIPGAYEAWNTLFGPEDYHIIIQDGRASAPAQFIFDTYDREGWDRGVWEHYVSRANYLRNSGLVGAKIGGSNYDNPAILPTHWEVRTGLDINIDSIYDYHIDEATLDVFELSFSGTAIENATDLYFEEIGPDYLRVDPQQDWTLSVYFQVLIPDPNITEYSLIILAYRDGAINSDYQFEGSLNESPTLFKRGWFTTTIPNNMDSVRVGVRFAHADKSEVSRFAILIGQPQLELGVTQPTAPIRTLGAPAVAYDKAYPDSYLNSAGHMIYGLVAPYSAPPPPPNYFMFDQFISTITPGELTHDRVYGTPTLNYEYADPAMRGLVLALPCTDEIWSEVKSSEPTASVKDTRLYYNETANLIGALFDKQGYITYEWNVAALPPAQWTMEALVYLYNNTDGYIAGFTSYPEVGNISDRTLYVANGKFGIYVGGGGGPEHIELGFAESGFYHLIAVCNPPNVTLYLNNENTSATFTTNMEGGRTDYGLTRRILEDSFNIDRTAEDGTTTRYLEEAATQGSQLYFAIGRAKTDPAYSFLPKVSQAFNGVLLMVNISTTPYNLGEVSGRFFTPYEHLWWKQPDTEVITDINPDKGWDIGYWDETPALILPPAIDAVTMALFTGGYLDLRPAGVDVDYTTQSLAGTPIFAFDVDAYIDVEELDFLTWDDDDAHGWDTGVWDGTRPIFSTDVRAPETLLAGWELAAWGDFRNTFPTHRPIVDPFSRPLLAA